MSQNQFFQIRRYLYFVNPNMAVGNDKLHKVRYVLDEFCAFFQSECIPYEPLTLDEAMVPFNGRLAFKQFVKDKSVKFGIKLWVLADLLTAYCFNMEV